MTKKVRSEYKILTAPDIRTLEELANQFGAEGWHPIGGVAILNGRMCQAITRRTTASYVADAIDGRKPKGPPRCEREYSAADGRKRCKLPSGHEGEHFMVRLPPL